MNRPATESLSARQAQIATMVVRGKSNREIAEALFVSPRTIDAHVAAIFNKLGIRTRVELVAALLAPGTPALGPDVPPVRSVNTIPNNLPRKLTSFINRDGEIAEIVALVEAHQLVTLIGSAGVGKTTTSLHVAASVLARFDDGAWFVEFAPLGSGNYLPSAIAGALGIVLPAGGDPLSHLLRDLRSKRALLVLDNCEHLVEPVGRIVATLLRECRRVKVLVTSRQRLGITGETAYRLPSLQVPSESSMPERAADVMRYAATELFARRARAIDNRFLVSDENAPAIAEICRRLDGIPLAIEFAAARSNILSPQQLRERLAERFHVLTNGNRDTIPRHKTLRAMIDWSHDLLGEPERFVFRRLGIFVNGFTLEGATAVCGDDDAVEVFEILTSLIDKSLVLTEADGRALRYRLLESTRVYASEKLAQSGESQSVAERHLRYLRDRFAELSAATDRTALTAEIDEAFATEIEDIRAALDGALARGDVCAGAELLANIESSWLWLGLQPEIVSRYSAYLSALQPEHVALLARLSVELSDILRNVDGQETRAELVAEQSVTYARRAGCTATLARALAYSNHSSRIDESARNLAEAESIAHGSARLRLQLLSERARLSGWRGDVDAELQRREELRILCRSLGRTRFEVPNAINLAELEHGRGNTTRAIRLARETLTFIAAENDGTSAHPRPQNPLGYTCLLTNLAGYLVATGDLVEAECAARAAIEALAGVERHLVRRCTAIEHLALVYALRHDVERAAVLAGYTGTVLDRPSPEAGKNAITTTSRLKALLRERLAPLERERLRATGADLTLEAAVARALDIDGGG